MKGAREEERLAGSETRPAAPEKDWLWLCSIPGLYWKQRMTLLSYFGSPGDIREAPKEEFGLWERLGLNWVQNLYPAKDPGFLEDTLRQMEKYDVSFVSCENPAFPEKLKQIPDCPHGLFYKGSLPAGSDTKTELFAGIVGARACSSYGSGMAEAISRSLTAEGVQIVSGMACGIDGIAQRSALENAGTTFAVLGSGLDCCYPRTNLPLFEKIPENGGLLSEFPCHVPPKSLHFPIRNRIISGLSDVLIVVEARKKSGSLITADLALEQGRDVYALPGRTGDSLSYGCNQLINQGAGIIVSPEQLLEQLSCRFPEFFSDRNRTKRKGLRQKHTRRPLSAAEKKILKALTQTPTGLAALTANTGLLPGELHSALVALQLDKLIVEVGKGQFALLP